jgi:hypothetical protein
MRVSKQSGLALDRGGAGRAGAVDQAAVGLTLSVCVGHPPQVSAHLGLRHKTLGVRAGQVVSLLRRWLPGVPMNLLGDQAYSILELGLHRTHQQVTLIAPFRLDAVLRQPIPLRDPHTVGRPRVVGPRLSSLQHVLHDPRTVWQRLTLD